MNTAMRCLEEIDNRVKELSYDLEYDEYTKTLFISNGGDMSVDQFRDCMRGVDYNILCIVLDCVLPDVCDELFRDYRGLRYVLTTSKFSSANVRSMRHMFDNCVELKFVDVANWDVCNVRSMENMFYWCRGLQKLDVSNWDVCNVRSMESMFYNCDNLRSLDVSNWNIFNLESTSGMFWGCENFVGLPSWYKE